jgi:predicted Zn-dependent peptidase
MGGRLAYLATGLLITGIFACEPAQSPYALDYPMPTHIAMPTERFRLPNGLEVLLSPDHTAPSVAVDLWYHVGSKDDPPSRAGLAHLFEHLMFLGSRHVPEGGHMTQLVEEGGRDLNAHTQHDRTAFEETVPPNELELALWLESDRMAFAVDGLTQDKLDRERKVVENELRQRFENEPYGMVPALVWGAAFPDPHPYHHPPIGDVAQLDAVTLDDARAFGRTWYVPPNCTLAIVGDFDPAATKALLNKYFATIAAGPPLPARPDTAPSALGHEVTLRIEADVPHPRIVIAWPVVPRYAPGGPELDVGAPALAGYLWNEVAEGTHTATSVTGSVEQGHLASLFDVTIDVAPGVSPEVVLSSIDERMHVIRGEKARYDRTQFSVWRTRVLLAPLYSAEKFLGRAELLELYNEDAGTPDFADREMAARREVIVEDVRKAYYDLLPWDRRVVAIVEPRAGAPRSGRLVRSM